MQVFKGEHDAGNKKSGLFLFEFTTIPNMVTHVTSIAVIHNQKELLSGLEGMHHVD
jgi:hypothetical protein